MTAKERIRMGLELIVFVSCMVIVIFALSLVDAR